MKKTAASPIDQKNSTKFKSQSDQFSGITSFDRSGDNRQVILCVYSRRVNGCKLIEASRRVSGNPTPCTAY
jgi:hypothetical protein